MNAELKRLTYLTLDECVSPFDNVAIEWPREFVKKLTMQFGVECPTITLLQHEEHVPHLASFTYSGVDTDSECTMLSGTGKQIEPALQEWFLKADNRSRQAITLLRIAINLCLLLSRYGYTESPELPEKYERMQRAMKDKKKSREKRDKAKQYLVESATRLTLSQEVKFHQHIPKVGLGESAGGGKKRPHHRRGFIRRQRCGERHTETKVIYIAPTFVGLANFKGNKADIEYTISV